MKLANVLVFNIISDECRGLVKCNIKLSDFGLAKECGEISFGVGHEYGNQGMLICSSPKFVVIRVHEVAMDIMSVGCIVLEMLLREGVLQKIT